jgi:hypothetical protein
MLVVRGKYQSVIATFEPDIVPDSPNWFAWLDAATTSEFAFYEDESDECLCYVQKRDGVWYVYRVRRNRTREVELGGSQAVTIAALWSAYRHLVNEELREQGSTTRQT